MSDHPSKQFVDLLMQKIKKHAALSRTDIWDSPNEGRAMPRWKVAREEAAEIERDIENSLYVAIDTAFDEGHERQRAPYRLNKKPPPAITREGRNTDGG